MRPAKNLKRRKIVKLSRHGLLEMSKLQALLSATIERHGSSIETINILALHLENRLIKIASAKPLQDLIVLKQNAVN
jgi:hypothetical protein